MTMRMLDVSLFIHASLQQLLIQLHHTSGSASDVEFLASNADGCLDACVLSADARFLFLLQDNQSSNRFEGMSPRALLISFSHHRVGQPLNLELALLEC